MKFIYYETRALNDFENEVKTMQEQNITEKVLM